MTGSAQQSALNQLINEVPSQVVLVNNRVGAASCIMHVLCMLTSSKSMSFSLMKSIHYCLHKNGFHSHNRVRADLSTLLVTHLKTHWESISQRKNYLPGCKVGGDEIKAWYNHLQDIPCGKWKNMLQFLLISAHNQFLYNHIKTATHSWDNSCLNLWKNVVPL